MSRKQLDRASGGFGDLGADDTGCHVIHVDMDAFFASVELLTRPELRGRPVIVGGRDNRGVVVSATYEAREYGVHAAMPMAQAVRQCPHAVVIPPSRGEYGRYSAQVMEVLESVTDRVAKVSIDEAFLDVSGSRLRLGSPARIARLIKDEVLRRTRLHCSLGVASNMLLAKLASTHSKPDGLLVVPAAKGAEFVQRLPVQALPGVGPSMQARLARYAISTVRDLAELGPERLQSMFGSHGLALAEQAHGRDARRVRNERPEKSISAEHTYFDPLYREQDVSRELLRLSDKVAWRLRRAGLVAGGLGLKLRRPDFRTLSRSVTLTAPTDIGQEIHAALLPAAEALGSAPGVRLLGVRAAGLLEAATAGRQAALDERPRARREAEQALDAVRDRFGEGSISAAALLAKGTQGRPEPRPEEH
ncbi:DNA polymerase IV [Sediminivirga luteola]|uniref:DNA polymerase IV n=1 Tax=Sediminivirga luteola TaxID=1774748 RepID=UPI001E3CAB7E|nr:DNA polymerase IV [Sediminivirga luteola]MCI2266921.1 DNA polymerase IV [Sediminivirga luteola]